jgi:GYF domain 2
MDYYIIQNGEANGPYTIGQLRAMWNSGAITGETLYCQEGWSEWLPLSTMIEDLEPSASVPSQNASPPPLLSAVPKPKRKGVKP